MLRIARRIANPDFAAEFFALLKDVYCQDVPVMFYCLFGHFVGLRGS